MFEKVFNFVHFFSFFFVVQKNQSRTITCNSNVIIQKMPFWWQFYTQLNVILFFYSFCFVVQNTWGNFHYLFFLPSLYNIQQSHICIFNLQLVKGWNIKISFSSILHVHLIRFPPFISLLEYQRYHFAWEVFAKTLPLPSFLYLRLIWKCCIQHE